MKLTKKNVELEFHSKNSSSWNSSSTWIFSRNSSSMNSSSTWIFSRNSSSMNSSSLLETQVPWMELEFKFHKFFSFFLMFHFAITRLSKNRVLKIEFQNRGISLNSFKHGTFCWKVCKKGVFCHFGLILSNIHATKFIVVLIS